MKKVFTITVEYPDCDYISTDEIIEVLEERMDSIGDYLDANIMDGVKDRLFTTLCSGNAIIDKACECIIKLHNWPVQYEEFAKFQEEFITAFRKAMEE